MMKTHKQKTPTRPDEKTIITSKGEAMNKSKGEEANSGIWCL
jgi:hypothetical protein